MIMFGCENWLALAAVAVFAAIFYIAILWFLKQGYIALGSQQDSSSPRPTIIKRADQPKLFWMAISGMTVFATYIFWRAISILLAICQHNANG